MAGRGYIILPKAIRGAVGISEGGEVLVEVKDGIILKPARRKVDVDEVRALLRKHAETLRRIPGRREPQPGELSQLCLEEEFEG